MVSVWYKYTGVAINISLKFVRRSWIDNISSIGTDQGLAPTRRQAIIWTNDYFFLAHVALGLNNPIVKEQIFEDGPVDKDNTTNQQAPASQ